MTRPVETLSRALNNPVVRITLAAGAMLGASRTIDLGRPSVAEAAGVCNRQEGKYSLLYHDVTYLDKAAVIPGAGRVGIFDKGVDPWVEKYVQSGLVNVITKDRNGQEKEVASAAVSPQAPKLPNFTLTNTDFNIGHALLSWRASCDGETTLANGKIVPSLKAWLVTSQDPTNRTFEILAKDGVVSEYWGGRKAPLNSMQDYERFLTENAGKLRDLDQSSLEVIRKAVQEKYGQGTPTPETPKTPTQKPTAISTPGPMVVEGNVRVQGVKDGDPIKIQKAEDFLWLPASVLGAGALIGLGLLARRDRMIEVHHNGHDQPDHHVPHAPQPPAPEQPTTPVRAPRPETPAERPISIIRERPLTGDVTRYDLIAKLDNGRPVRATVTAAGEQVVSVNLADAPRYQTRILGGFRRSSDSGKVKKIVQEALNLGEMGVEPAPVPAAPVVEPVTPAIETQAATEETQESLSVTPQVDFQMLTQAVEQGVTQGNQAVVEGLDRLARRTQTLAGNVTRGNRAIQEQLGRLQQPTITVDEAQQVNAQPAEQPSPAPRRRGSRRAQGGTTQSQQRGNI